MCVVEGEQDQWRPMAGGPAVGSGLPLRVCPHRARSQAGAETGPARWPFLAGVYSGVSSYTSLRGYPTEVVKFTWNPVVVNYLDWEVPVIGYVCVCVSVCVYMCVYFTLLVPCSFSKRIAIAEQSKSKATSLCHFLNEDLGQTA